MNRNEMKKATFEDKFARHYYCQNAKRNYIKFAKKYNNRQFRRLMKKSEEL